MIRRADGVALDEYVSIRRQGTDVSGNPVSEGSRVADGWTGEDGIFAEGVPPDTYILDFDANGWPWTAQFANHVVAAGQRTNVLFDLSLLTVGVRYADGNPADKYVKVFLQDTNVSGDPVEGSTAEDGWSSDDGLITFELTPGTYAIKISDVAGYDTWGRFDHAVPGGGNYTVILTLGRLAVETWNLDGTLATGVYVKVYELATDSSGNSVFAESVDAHSSDNTGRAVFDLTPGMYGVQVGQELEFVDIPVQSGQMTIVKQTGYTIP